jgi:hypothetical protein
MVQTMLEEVVELMCNWRRAVMGMTKYYIMQIEMDRVGQAV